MIASDFQTTKILSKNKMFHKCPEMAFYYWPAYYASIVLLAGVCRRLSVTLPAGGRTGRSPGARAVGRPTLTAGQ